MNQISRRSQFLFALALLAIMLVGCTADNAMLSVLRGNNERGLGDSWQAVFAYNRAIVLDPGLTEAYYNRGLAYYDLHDYQRTIHDMDRVIALEPEAAEAYGWRGTAYSVLGNNEQALLDYDKAIARDPTYAEHYYYRGYVLTELGSYEQAIEDYNAAIELGYASADLYFDRGRTYNLMGRYDEAIVDFNQAIELDSRFAATYHERGIAYYYAGNTALAIEDLSTAIELDPSNARIYHDRGYTYYLSDKIPQAIDDLSKAIELEPENPGIYYTRGTVYLYAAEFDRAIEDFSQTLALDTTFAEAYRMRGNAYRANLELELALLDYEKYLELAPDAPERGLVVAAIEEVKRRPEELIEIVSGEGEIEKASSVTTTNTFVSPDFPWSISYPADWRADATDPAFVGISRSVDDSLFSLCGVHSNAASFTTVQEFVDFVIDYEDDYFKERGQTYVILSRQEITLTSGLNGIELMVELGPGGKSRRVYFLTTEYMFAIDCETSVMDWPQLVSTYDQIINSFTLDSTR